ncbi:MAG: hypothetical protein A3F09_00545 [Chlamydiae bacterium RIFCSPHIGHO2_12_FULL_49_11]|nr:MAG: hypothetical protein A3F09_00545 [Chlamydiae bacterium RIFCSPHIGHO2_12_FULL_49_11]
MIAIERKIYESSPHLAFLLRSVEADPFDIPVFEGNAAGVVLFGDYFELKPHHVETGATFIYAVHSVGRWLHFIRTVDSRLLLHERVHIFFPATYEEVRSLVHSFSDVVQVGENGTTRLITDVVAAELCRTIENAGSQRWKLHQCIAFLHSRGRVVDGMKLEGALLGETAVIVGGHPDLPSHFETIRALMPKAHIFAAGRAPFILSENGIDFDYAVEADPNPDLSRSCAVDKPVFCTMRAHPDWFKHITGPRCVMGASPLSGIESFLLRRVNLTPTVFDGGYHAASLAYAVACHLGCTRICLIGIEEDPAVMDRHLGQRWLSFKAGQNREIVHTHVSSGRPFDGFAHACPVPTGKHSLTLDPFSLTGGREAVRALDEEIEFNRCMLQEMGSRFVPLDPDLYHWWSTLADAMPKELPRHVHYGTILEEMQKRVLFERYPALETTVLLARDVKGKPESIPVTLEGLEAAVVLIFGLCAPDVAPFLSHNPHRRIIFLEDDIGRIKNCESECDRLFLDKRVELLYLSPHEELEDYLWHALLPYVEETVTLIFAKPHPTLEHIFKEVHFKVLHQYYERMAFPLVVSNILHNSRFMEGSFALHQFKGVCRGETVIVCGAGPSLEKQMKELRKAQSRHVIIACGSAISALGHAKIRPDLHVAIDPTEEEVIRVKNTPYLDVPLCFSLRLNKDVAPLCMGRRVYLPCICPHALEAEIERVFEGSAEAHTSIPDAFSVLFLGLWIAEVLGASCIILAGVDLGRMEDKLYASGVSVLHRRDTALQEVDWALQKKGVERFIRDRPHLALHHLGPSSLILEGAKRVEVLPLRRERHLLSRFFAEEKPLLAEGPMDVFIEELHESLLSLRAHYIKLESLKPSLRKIYFDVWVIDEPAYKWLLKQVFDGIVQKGSDPFDEVHLGLQKIYIDRFLDMAVSLSERV